MPNNKLPIIILILLAPFVAEILSGSTPVSEVFGLVFFIPMYGSGTLLIRELVIRSNRGWISIFLLGLAFGLIEECLIVQVIFNPAALPATLWGVGAGGEFFGIYVVFTLAVVTYHAVWSILIPILITDVLFPKQQRVPYVGRKGLTITFICYILGVLIVSFIVRTKSIQGYHAPVILLIFTSIVIVLIVFIALKLTPVNKFRANTSHNNINPWLILITAFSGGFIFLGLLIFSAQFRAYFGTYPYVILPVVGSIATAITIGLIVYFWSRNTRWSSIHQLQLAFAIWQREVFLKQTL